MSSFTCYNSRDPFHKSVFGCLEAGKECVFTVRLPRDLGAGYVDAVFDTDEGSFSLPMSWVSTDGYTELWRLKTAFDRPALFFYYFNIKTHYDAELTVLCTDLGVGEISDAGDRWQLTVYDGDQTTPDWLKGSVIYQIFPDRFASSGKKKRGVPRDRVLHSSMHELPKWRPDPDGVYRNNDYFGGDLEGIEADLDRLASLGIGCIYLNPIFEAHSNHRYDVADYTRIDPLLGGEDDFRSLCEKAHSLGIRVILDGVFNHTGADSVYFNKYGRYPGAGAYQSVDSPYYKWYSFSEYPDKYDCWWGFDNLPDVNETEPTFVGFITGEGGVIDKWMGLGADGFRLDVADELPDSFIEHVRRAVRRNKPDGLVLGEVWEDASNKISYSVRRRYFLGSELDSVMNYPFRRAVIDFALGGSAESFSETVIHICENYPPCVLNVLMNPLGTHDTERILSVLGGLDAKGAGREEQSLMTLDGDALARAKRLLRFAVALQYALPGVPSIYYGDEAGMTGMKDPFNRAFYPRGNEDKDLMAFYAEIGSLRRSCPQLRDGEYVPVSAMLGCVAFKRVNSDGALFVIANNNDREISYRINEAQKYAPIYGCRALGGSVFAVGASSVAMLRSV